MRKSKGNRFKTAPQIRLEMRSEHSVEISTCTRQRRLRKVGLHGRKAKRKSYLSTTHKRARLTFARDHEDWTAEQWSKGIFSDECRFLLFRSDGCSYVRQGTGEEFREDCLKATVKHGGGGIVVWGVSTHEVLDT